MNMNAFCSLLPELQEGSLDNRLTMLNPAWHWQAAPKNATPLGRLLTDNLAAQQTVLTFKNEHQAPTAKVAASLVHKQWITNLLSPLAAIYLLTGHPPEDWKKLGYDSSQGRIGWTTQPFGKDKSAARFFETITDIANACYLLFWRNFSVNPRILWSNTALALASPWNRLQSLGVDGKTINTQLVAFFSHFPPSLSQSVKWLTVSQNERTLCAPRRLGCCLKYTLPGNENKLCGTCHRRSEPEQIALINQRFFTPKT